MICDAFDVVIVPFPFAEIAGAKRRPAAVLSDASSFQARSGHALMAMITTKAIPAWPFDVPIAELASAGLKSPSVIRMKLFTLDLRLVLGKLGSLGPTDKKAVQNALKNLLGLDC
ncbi:MAG: type II toxin-antitoxin system PemK/MazF family toxin [Nitrospirota bacterium]|nr:type II toxin-antitoxin system PemK/MazF family toxin [Nitrospirota bacterium]